MAKRMFSERGQGILKWVIYVLIIVSAAFVTISISSGFIMDYYWFKSVGYLGIFMTNLKYQLLLLFAGWIITTICLLLSWRTVRKALDDQIPTMGDRLFKVFSVFVGLGVGWWFRGKYLIVLKYLNQAPWGVPDPVFGHDVSFYVFTLPFARTLLSFAAAVAGLVLFLTVLTYGVGRFWLEKEEEEEMDFFSERETSIWSLKRLLRSWPILGSVIALTAAGTVFVWLGRYSYLWRFSPGTSVPTGASYMAVHYLIPYTWIKAAGVALLGALVVHVLLNFDELREKFELGGFFDLKREIALIGAVVVVFIIIPAGVFGALRTINVQPNEPGIQEPYLERTIHYTNKAYDLDNLVQIPYTLRSENLTPEEALGSPTVKNARIVDYRPTRTVYQERQRLRMYYEFPDVDVNRYMTEKRKQIALTAGREIDLGKVPMKGGEWQNKHLIYTHGFGAVASPASRTQPEGTPIMAVRDIPPVSEWENVKIEEPRLYFGEMTEDYALVRAKDLEEFDYPKGENNVTYRYKFESGVSLGSTWRKMIAWFYTGDFNLLVSDYVGGESKLLLHRNVHDRVKKIAPFLRYDSNAHFFIGEDGGLYYLLNGITTAERYPYSYSDGEAPGYLSDSVKAFVEANTGRVKFYKIREDDPMVQTYSNMYSDLFMEEEMPSPLRNHLIYPQDLFSTQMKIFRRYHMRRTRTFYKQEDLWTFAQEQYQGRTKRVEAYNILLDARDIPRFENNREEFTLIKPFTPRGKNNMIAWVGIAQDPSNYGKMLLLEFPKGEFMQGPMQVESMIDRDPTISKQFSLWRGPGSDVLRGNLLVLPVKDDILYIEPIYLSGEVLPYPQLKRVVAVYRDKVVMENRLDRAVTAALGGRVRPKPPENIPGENVAPPELVDLVREYLELREEYNEKMRQGEYAEAGEIRERMEAVAENMEKYIS